MGAEAEGGLTEWEAHCAMSGSGSQLANRERKQTPDTRLRRTNSDNKSTCSKLLPCADTLVTREL